MNLEPRISTPAFKADVFENVLLYIVERCADKPNVGKTVLNKLLYFCDFNFYELYEEQLTGASYRKMQYGPVPQELEITIEKLTAKGLIATTENTNNGFRQTRYLPLGESSVARLSNLEKSVIDDVISQMGDWTAREISDYSHGDMPWIATNEKAEIEYNLAFYRNSPYSVRTYKDEL